MNKQLESEEGLNLRIFEVVSRLKREVDGLYEELEILMNKKMVESVERSRKEIDDLMLIPTCLWTDMIAYRRIPVR